ncbi:MAG TPA: GNAT family N-acetyltransferase [Candidatus Dormibacteraeota bacterium]|nr:GNAT family N-acetyltransferase [Candidatus Dormibacteraeota bacterium]
MVEPRNIVRELRAGETHLAYVGMLELRPHLGSSADFVRTVDDTQRPAGYRLIASFDEDEQAAAVAGFRVIDYLAWGHALYCDDLSTRQMYRGRGHAGLLMDWMIGEARRLGCGEFHLDSGVGPDRTAAHRLYFNKGMRISSHHFSRSV